MPALQIGGLLAFLLQRELKIVIMAADIIMTFTSNYMYALRNSF